MSIGLLLFNVSPIFPIVKQLEIDAQKPQALFRKINLCYNDSLLVSIKNPIGIYTLSYRHQDIYYQNAEKFQYAFVAKTIDLLKINGIFKNELNQQLQSDFIINVTINYFKTTKPLQEIRTTYPSVATISAYAPGEKFRWNTGDTTKSISLKIIEPVTTVSVEISEKGCSTKEVFNIYAEQAPIAKLWYASHDKDFIVLKNESQLVYSSENKVLYEMYVDENLLTKSVRSVSFFKIPYKNGKTNVVLIANNDYGTSRCELELTFERGKLIHALAK